jgi:peroxiredoxin Q/BCP
MSAFSVVCTSLGLLLAVAAAVQAQPVGELKPGDVAPAFALPGSDGKTYNLSDFKGKKAVVLAWFPKAFTGG